jgi:phosphatidate phosphatase PAH1
LKLKLSEEQIYLRRITGKTFSKEDAANLWTKVTDNKWYLGEILGRDIGLGVATLDYLENFTGDDYISNEGEKLSELYAGFYNSFA